MSTFHRKGGGEVYLVTTVLKDFLCEERQRLLEFFHIVILFVFFIIVIK